jgi:hypothetical protein
VNWKLLLISSVFLIGCAGKRVQPIEDVQVVTKWRTFDCGYSPVVDFVDFHPLTWKVIDGRFTLSTDEYAKLGENVSQIIKVTKQLLLKIEYYEECINSAGEDNAE